MFTDFAIAISSVEGRSKTPFDKDTMPNEKGGTARRGQKARNAKTEVLAMSASLEPN